MRFRALILLAAFDGLSTEIAPFSGVIDGCNDSFEARTSKKVIVTTETLR